MGEVITINELFSGIGAQKKALERLGIPHKVVGICEIDKYAIQSYEAVFGKTFNYGDISQAKRLNYADLWTYSFPCQDISVAGKQRGINKETRSGLLYQVQRLLEVAKIDNSLPKYLLLENVKNLVGRQNKEKFNDWIKYLDELGYNTHWQVLNAKDYGIPQNRERVFALSIRKDVEQPFSFPKKEVLKFRLKDLLESPVDEKYYIDSEKVKTLINSLCKMDMADIIKNEGPGSIDKHIWDLVTVKEATKKGYAVAEVGDSINVEHPNSKTRRGRVGRGVAQTITTAPQQVVMDVQIAACRGRYNEDGSIQQQLELNRSSCTNTITTVQKDNYVLENNIVYDDYNSKIRQDQDTIGVITPNCAKSALRNGYKIIQIGLLDIKGNEQVRRVYSPEGISPTLNTMQGGNRQPKIYYELRIRKLTPLECWRLMGFDDSDFYKAKYYSQEYSKEILKKYPNHKGKRIFSHEERIERMSNSQLYKQAGNSIVVDVLEKIFGVLFAQLVLQNQYQEEMAG